MESIPHIYRHASFSLRATPPSLPHQGKTLKLFLMTHLSQCQQKLSRLIKPSCGSLALTSRWLSVRFLRLRHIARTRIRIQLSSRLNCHRVVAHQGVK
jgi:hypothetical protein